VAHQLLLLLFGTLFIVILLRAFENIIIIIIISFISIRPTCILLCLSKDYHYLPTVIMTQRHLVNGPKTPFVGNNAFIHSTQNNDQSILLRRIMKHVSLKRNVIIYDSIHKCVWFYLCFRVNLFSLFCLQHMYT